MRMKRRYIAFRIHSAGAVAKKDFVHALLDEMLAMFGERLTAEVGLWVLDFDERRRRGFLTCSHRYVGEVIAAISLIHRLSGARASVEVLGVSGTIRSLKRKFLKEDGEIAPSQTPGE
ncbi:MAG: ribonuclease P protein component 2 [Methanobacteriota archaeon]|nr:MAG: ribonuclease P protein component 2 [Euryarchaeota archaeon]